LHNRDTNCGTSDDDGVAVTKHRIGDLLPVQERAVAALKVMDSALIRQFDPEVATTNT
jgi:hypothetical protein